MYTPTVNPSNHSPVICASVDVNVCGRKSKLENHKLFRKSTTSSFFFTQTSDVAPWWSLKEYVLKQDPGVEPWSRFIFLLRQFTCTSLINTAHHKLGNFSIDFFLTTSMWKMYRKSVRNIFVFFFFFLDQAGAVVWSLWAKTTSSL